jgi:hypothetical protein
MTAELEIHAILQQFQEGYTRRDIGQVPTFMELFLADAEVIGTNGFRPGADEWFLDRVGAADLVAGDWESWGDLRLDLAAASIHTNGKDAAWVAIPATVTTFIGKDNYDSYLNFVMHYLETSPLSAEQKLHNILRGGTNTIFEVERGEKFVWPVRITASLLRVNSGWKFAQMHFSFPTIYFPDVRVFD